MSERTAWLIYRMLKATINTIGNVPGDNQSIFNDAEREFIKAMDDFNARQVPETQAITAWNNRTGEAK